MKNIISKRFFALIAVMAFSLSVFAYAADVTGKYKGMATLEGAGAVDITAEIKVEDGKYSGTLDSALGNAAIVSGKLEDKKLTLDLDANGSAVTMTGTVTEDGKIKGDVTGAVNGTFELTRDAATR